MGIKWSHWSGTLELGTLLGRTARKYGQYVVQEDVSQVAVQGRLEEMDRRLPKVMHTKTSSTMEPNSQRHKRKEPWDNRKAPDSWADAKTWHRRMGHIGPDALASLSQESLGVKIRGPTTAECDDSALAKITENPFLQPARNKATRPFHRVAVDAHDLSEGWDGYQGDGRLVRRVFYHL